MEGLSQQNRAPGNKAKDQGEGKVMTLYLFKIQEAEFWGRLKQRGGATSNSSQHPSAAKEGLQLFTSAEVFHSSYPATSLASISSVPYQTLSYLHQRYLSWLHLDGSSLAGLHPKWKSFTAPSWASTSGQRTSTNPPAHSSLMGPKRLLQLPPEEARSRPIPSSNQVKLPSKVLQFIRIMRMP